MPRGVPDQRTFRDPTNPRRLDSNESERRRAGQLRQHMQPSLDRPESSSSSQPLARENPDDAVSIVQASDQRVGTTNGEQDNDAGPRQPQHEAIDHMSADIAIGAGAEEEYAQPENLDVDPKVSGLAKSLEFSKTRLTLCLYVEIE